MTKKVFVSGCYDLLHSGHVEFFRQAAQYGDLYVGIGSDETILHYKHHKTIYSEDERLFMVKAIRYVKDAYINAGDGIMDFVPTLDIVKPDIFVVNEDGGNEEKRRLCAERGIEYVVLQRTPQEGLQARSSTALKQTPCQIPTRLDLAGTWIDQPYVSCFAPGWALTISLEPTFEVALELDVVNVDEVDKVHIQTLHALIDTFCDALGRVVPGVHAVLTVAAHLGREIILIAWNLLQGLAQYHLGLKVTVVGRDIDEVDTIVDGCVYGTDTFFLTDTVEHAA